MKLLNTYENTYYKANDYDTLIIHYSPRTYGMCVLPISKHPLCLTHWSKRDFALFTSSSSYQNWTIRTK